MAEGLIVKIHEKRVRALDMYVLEKILLFSTDPIFSRLDQGLEANNLITVRYAFGRGGGLGCRISSIVQEEAIHVSISKVYVY